MRKEFTTLLVAVDEENLTGQELAYYRRMLSTLQAVDVLVEKDIPTTTCFSGIHRDATIALVDNETAKEQACAAHLPVVYYSHECIGGYGADMLLMSFGEIGYDFFAQIFDRFHGQPWTILETRRCILREAVLSDLDAFYEIYGQPTVARFMEPLSLDYEEEQEKLAAYIKNQYTFYGFGIWTILSDDKIIGRAGLNIDETTGNIQLGYVIREEYQGQGIATEVCEAIIKYAKTQLDLTELELRIDPDNEASLNLAKKLGFQPVCQGLTYCNLLRISL